MYTLVVFDWDGTIVDSARRIVDAVKHAGRSCGLPEADRDRIVSTIGLSLESMFSLLYPAQDATVIDQLTGAYRDRWFNNTSIDMPIFDGAIECLDSLDREDRQTMLAIATGKSRRGLDRSLAETGLAGRFVTSRCADEAFGKPNPQMLIDILEFTGQETHSMVMVGDSAFDMQMAANAGVDAVGVTWGSHERDRLSEAGAQACFDDYSSLSGWLTENTT